MTTQSVAPKPAALEPAALEPIDLTPADPGVDTTFHTDQVATIAGAHFIHDSFSAFLTPLLPVIKETLSTNYAMTGSLTIFTMLPSLLNPFIGYLADRISLYFVPSKLFNPGCKFLFFRSIGTFHCFLHHLNSYKQLRVHGLSSFKFLF